MLQRATTYPNIIYSIHIILTFVSLIHFLEITIIMISKMWANAQRDGRPVEYRWRPLFNAAKFG